VPANFNSVKLSLLRRQKTYPHAKLYGLKAIEWVERKKLLNYKY